MAHKVHLFIYSLHLYSAFLLKGNSKQLTLFSCFPFYHHNKPVMLVRLRVRFWLKIFQPTFHGRVHIRNWVSQIVIQPLHHAGFQLHNKSFGLWLPSVAYLGKWLIHRIFLLLARECLPLSKKGTDALKIIKKEQLQLAFHIVSHECEWFYLSWMTLYLRYCHCTCNFKL